MDIVALTDFFMWCTLINGALLLLSTVALSLAPDLVYRVHGRWFARLPREHFDLAVYVVLGLFKLLFIVFSLTPYLALLIVA